MKKKLIWGIILLCFGFLVFLSGSQYVGAGFVFVGLILLDLYSEEKKELKKKSLTNNIINESCSFSWWLWLSYK
jgi:hypothetical protein